MQKDELKKKINFKKINFFYSSQHIKFMNPIKKTK